MQSPDCRRYAPLSGEANYPAGARPRDVLSFHCVHEVKNKTLLQFILVLTLKGKKSAEPKAQRDWIGELIKDRHE
jgi:hypothetical protein